MIVEEEVETKTKSSRPDPEVLNVLELVHRRVIPSPRTPHYVSL